MTKAETYSKKSRQISDAYQVKMFGIIEKFGKDIQPKLAEVFNETENFIFNDPVIREIAKAGNTEFDPEQRKRLDNILTEFLISDAFKSRFKDVLLFSLQTIRENSIKAYKWVIERRVKLYNESTPRAMTLKFRQTDEEKKAIQNLTSYNNLTIKENLNLITANYRQVLKSRVMTEINKAVNIAIARQGINATLKAYREDLQKKISKLMQDILFRAYSLANSQLSTVNKQAVK